MQRFNRWSSDQLEARWLAKVEKTDDHWWWIGTTQKAGPYGVIKKNNKALLAHRVSWEIVNGPIPEGLTIDHLCAQTLCVNPAHLDLTTRSENSRRQNERLRPPTCPKGHADFGQRANGKRYCKGCNHDAYLRRKGLI